MAWSAPMTATSGQFDADDFNTYVRDNLLETLPALATSNTEASWFVTTGANALARREIKSATQTGEGTRASTSYGALTGGGSGPAVTITTGAQALAIFTAAGQISSTNVGYYAGVSVNGDAINDRSALHWDGITSANNICKGRSYFFTGLTPGSNTFTMQYKCDSGTATFLYRQLIVWAF